MNDRGRSLGERLLPRSADNSYRGHTAAAWLLGVVVFMKSAIGVNSIINGHTVASSADGIPLATFPPAAAETIVSLFGLLGLAGLTISLLSVVVLVRYRALIPLVFALMIVEHVSRRIALVVHPIATSGTPPGNFVTLTMLAAMLVGLVLSLRERR